MSETAKKIPLLKVRNLKQYFPVRKAFWKKVNYVKAVDGVSFTLYEGETFGLVGESGCGKSTTGRSLLRLIEPTGGESFYQGNDIFKFSQKEMKDIRKDFQMVFQDPYSSLNPKKRIGKSLEEPLAIHNIGTGHDRTEKVMKLLNNLGFSEEQYYRFPHEFSGGQRQRIGIARALTINPKVMICDEPVSALDVSIQSQILNLLEEIQEDYHLTYLFISHDLSVVRHISDRIGVMYLGKIVETAATEELFKNPKHPYTQALLSAVPVPDTVKRKEERIELKGEIPSPINPPSGCSFHTRCPFVTEECKQYEPILSDKGNEHSVACHLYNDDQASSGGHS